MSLYIDTLIAEATGEYEPSVIREIERLLNEPALEGFLGDPPRAARQANAVRQLRKRS